MGLAAGAPPPKHTQPCTPRTHRGRQRLELAKSRKGESEHTLSSTTQPGLEQASALPGVRRGQGRPCKDSEWAAGIQGGSC